MDWNTKPIKAICLCVAFVIAPACGHEASLGTEALSTKMRESTGFPTAAGTTIWTQVSTGPLFSCGLTRDGRGRCWGELPESVPEHLQGHLVQVRVGGDHVCAVRVDGTVACWGQGNLRCDFYGFTGGLGAPPGGVFRSVQVGLCHACGLRPDGRLDCWGSSERGGDIPPLERF